MSKTYGLAGLRIGWIATQDRAFFDQVAALKDYTTICNSAPSEFLAELALRHRHQIAERNLNLIRHNLTVLEAFFARHTDLFAWQRPVAGPIAFPRLLGRDVEDFCHDVVTNASVLLVPGTIYDHGLNHFRVGFGRRNLPEAVAQLDSYLAQRRA